MGPAVVQSAAIMKVRTLLAGALLIGTLDILFAIGFWLPRGVAPIRIFQSIAAGLLGTRAFSGGPATAILGGALHYFIALAIVVVYWLVGRRVAFLVRHPLACGAIYGIGVYLVMNYVVIPLSAAGRPKRFLVWWVVSSVVVHAFLIGVPAALFARAAARGNAEGF
jgi:hypothetical protein